MRVAADDDIDLPEQGTRDDAIIIFVVRNRPNVRRPVLLHRTGIEQPLPRLQTLLLGEAKLPLKHFAGFQRDVGGDDQFDFAPDSHLQQFAGLPPKTSADTRILLSGTARFTESAFRCGTPKLGGGRPLPSDPVVRQNWVGASLYEAVGTGDGAQASSQRDRVQ